MYLKVISKTKLVISGDKFKYKFNDEHNCFELERRDIDKKLLQKISEAVNIHFDYSPK